MRPAVRPCGSPRGERSGRTTSTKECAMSHQHPPVLQDVIIAGGGPVGLFLACELRLFGLSVLVLERAADPGSPLKRLPFGMRGLSLPTLEALHRRGLLEDVVAAQRINDAAGRTAAGAHWMQQTRRPAGHFAGIQFFHDDIDAAKWPLPPAQPGRHDPGRHDGGSRNDPGPPRCRAWGRDPAWPRRRRFFGFGSRGDRSSGRRDFSRTLAGRLRWRPKHDSQGRRL